MELRTRTHRNYELAACVGYNYTINEPQKWICNSGSLDANTIFIKLGTKLLNYENKNEKKFHKTENMASRTNAFGRHQSS